MEFVYETHNVCSAAIAFDLQGETVKDIRFLGGCEGNLKAISKLVDGWSISKIEEYLLGNTCGGKDTSCADQLARAVRAAYEKSQEV